MKRAIICLLPLLAACGGGNPQPNAAPAPATHGAPAKNDAPKANTDKADPPKEDPDAYRKVSGNMPSGWHTLKTPVKKELERHTKGVPAEWKFVSGIVNEEAPGSTEPPEVWGEWEKKAAGAMLYFVPAKADSAKAAVQAHAEKIAAGTPDIKEGSGIAWTQMQGGEVLVIGLSNKLGTYVAVGVVLTTEAEPTREAIRKWAESIKPE
jgi:hypothetical protein